MPRLLVVDDEADLREILCFTFERKGYETFQASNAVEALAIVKDTKVDAIISDIRMPGGDGVQLLEAVKKTNANIPTVLFITGFADITLEEAYDKGCEAVFSKPFDPNVLLAAVERLIHRETTGQTLRPARLETSIQINVQHKGLEEAQKAHVLNIGRGGFFIRMAENFPKLGDTLNFRFSFGDEVVTVVEGEGTVKWIRSEATDEYPPGCGVEFTNLSDSTKGKLVEIINFITTTQYIPRK